MLIKEISQQFFTTDYSNFTIGAIFLSNTPWMLWNALLALFPAILAHKIFRGRINNRIIWWFLFILFFIFIPNAPYTVTDLIHLYEQIVFTNIPIWQIIMLLVPQYISILLIGLISYILSMEWWIRWSQRSQLKRFWNITIWLISPIAFSYAIWLGRFMRFNSWNLIHQPLTILFATRQLIQDPFFVIFTLGWIATLIFLNWLATRMSITKVIEAFTSYSKARS